MTNLDSSPELPPDTDVIHFRDVSPMLELICWTIIVLAPFLRWVNGPAVSTDQLVTQITVLTVAVLGAISLRLFHWRRRRQSVGDSS